MKKYNVFDCTMVELDKHYEDRRVNLTVVGNGITLPFYVRWVYYFMMSLAVRTAATMPTEN